MTAPALSKYTAGTCRTRSQGGVVPAVRFPNRDVAILVNGKIRRYDHASTAARSFQPNPAYHAVLQAELELALAERAHEEALEVTERLHRDYEAALVVARAALDRRDRAARALTAVEQAASET